jgi:ferredoxin
MRNLLRRIFFRRSTRSFMAEADKLETYSLIDRIHGYVYSRWPYFYISMGTGEHPWKKQIDPLWKRLGHLVIGGKRESATENRGAFADTYHGKVVPPRLARQLVTVNRDVDLGDLERVIPYAQARDIILKNPDHIVALNCPCRAIRETPCLPLDVCLIVGEPFAGFIAEHHPQKSRWITQTEAVQILEAEHDRGHVHHAFFKDAMLGRFYAICNCCSCCCGAMQLFRNGMPMLASSGFVARIDEADCIACGTCVEACPFEAITVNGIATVNGDACMGCGICESKCEQQAARLERDPEKGTPLEIRSLMDAAYTALVAEASGGDGHEEKPAVPIG